MKTSNELLPEAKLDIINRTRTVLNGKVLESDELKTLYKELEKMDQFAYATEVLLKKMETDETAGSQVSIKEFQTLAKFIYKDHSLPSSFKFDEALKQLKSHDDLAITEKCESLGLAGAVYKRKWQFDHQFKNLIFSSYYYKKGYALWKDYLLQGGDPVTEDNKNDNGFTAINYAYINELMAVDQLEEHGRITGISETINSRLAEADEARKFIAGKLNSEQATDKWILATLAEAHFGLRNYDLALALIKQCVDLNRKNIVKEQKKVAAEEQKKDPEKMLAWEMRTFSRQLFSIAYLQLFQKNFFPENYKPAFDLEKRLCGIAGQIDVKKINECLAVFALTDQTLPDKKKYFEIKKDGKVGIALSGGGFRASLFHIGVLAALAEADELRNVEVISCVSGGSIIGAYYYLKLKLLLETKTDDDIVRDDYIRLVKETESDFLEGVQKNLRMQLFSNFSANIKMLVYKNYSRTHRMGELYEKHLFKKILVDKERYEKLLKDYEQCTKQVQDMNSGNELFVNNQELNELLEKQKYNQTRRDKYDEYSKMLEEADGNIYMHHLFIKPKLEGHETFDFATDNWKRKNKIPQLVLNATSVNTGHNWQFTASWMGEPPGNILADIDVKPRLRRMYYKEAPLEFQNFRLGYAVGASSCVPVMFHPMPMYGLYPEIDLQLIDGGLHDNQGIASLIEQECNNMIISDASGQLPTNKIAAANEAALFYRADSILQERLRELQFLDLKERSYTTQLNRLITVHLKNDLAQNPKNWKFCNDPPRQLMYANHFQNNNNSLTKYGMLRSVQLLLSEIRTDLDSFNDTEAYALMYSGYVQANFEYGKSSSTDKSIPDANWDFLKIKDYVSLPSKAEEINKQLLTAKKLALKVVDVSLKAKIALMMIAALFLAGLIYLGYSYWDETIVNITVKFIAIAVIIFLIGLLSKFIARLLSYKTTMRKYLVLASITIIGFIVSNIYLYLLNPLYNKSGKLKENKDR